jgi:undecaprenyl-diphosphatase
MVAQTMLLPILVKALILGVVEGITEFLPISSTGHLILAGSLLGYNDATAKVFEVVIQVGAILAIMWEYRSKLLSVLWRLKSDARARRFVFNLLIAFLPAALSGLFFSKLIVEHLFKPIPVALAFILGAFVILWAEKRTATAQVLDVDSMTWRDSLKVGLAQVLALVPGTSRSGATIIGGMLFGLSRRTATEFSFFLAIPTLIAAAGYDLLKYHSLIHSTDLGQFAVGLIAAFVSAFLCVRWLLRFISHNNFNIFAWYRIAFGGVVLLTAYFGWVTWGAG